MISRTLHRGGEPRRSLAGRIALLVGLILAALVVLYPILLILNISLKSYQEFLVNPSGLVQEVRFNNYAEVFKRLDVVKNTVNTLLYTVIACAVNVAIVLLGAYPISRRHFRGSEALFSFLMVSMLLPTTMIATLFLLQNVFHLYGTPAALIYVWALGGVQFNTFMVVGFIRQIPRELDEAAFIDGSGYVRHVFTMILPLVKPILATVIIFKMVSCWNDFLTPYIYAGSRVKTLSTGLFFYTGQYGNKWNLLSAAVMIVALPMILFYVFFQKWIISGMISGALKG